MHLRVPVTCMSPALGLPCHAELSAFRRFQWPLECAAIQHIVNPFFLCGGVAFVAAGTREFLPPWLKLILSGHRFLSTMPISKEQHDELCTSYAALALHDGGVSYCQVAFFVQRFRRRTSGLAQPLLLLLAAESPELPTPAPDKQQ